MAFRQWLVLLVVSTSALTALPALAEEKGDSSETPAAESEGADAEPSGSEAEKGGGDEGAGDKAEGDAAKKPAEDPEASPVEEPGKTYRFVGARYRLIVVPSFMINMFADGGGTVAVHSAGPEFGIRKDNFEYNFGLWLAGYGMEPTPFKGKNDGEDAWEIIESDIKVLYLTADFMWSHPFTPQLALNYGMGAGLGFVWGPLYRTQAMRVNGELVPCPGAPPTPGANPAYCGNDNDHYDGYEEPSWTNGGSKPSLFPWFAVQTGLRYKAHRRFVARLDVGMSLSGFFFGLGADYGI